MDTRCLKTFVLLLFALTLTISAPLEAKKKSGKSDGGLRYTVLVSDFENKSGWRGQANLGSELGEVLTSVLHESQRFIVLGENDLRRQSMEEQDLVASGRGASGNDAPATGRMAAAQLIVRGAITHVQDDTASDNGGIGLGRGLRVGAGRNKTEINATFYMVDSSSGMVVASKNVVAGANSFGFNVRKRNRHNDGEYGMKRKDNLMKALIKASEEAVEWMSAEVDGLVWKGQVVMKEGDKIYVNRGQREGTFQGMSLEVGTLKTLTDPTTGEILDQFIDPVVAKLEVEQVKEKLSICRVVSGKPADVRNRSTVMRAAGS